MAAYVNRSVSMMAGDGPHNVAPLNNGAVRVNMSNVDSPLQIFVRAKKKINDIFVEIDDYVKDAVTFMHGELYCFSAHTLVPNYLHTGVKERLITVNFM